ncbi:hypothetical protein DDW44_17580 [Streptomyces tirandamycinicus]|uniref:Uncharacterized protein n=1 Tax=Streptomyces tirandamycinicus TaxID=2174846 RepID=A0A2S1SVH5_9ACTN|nr:hypothetical protein DDW44_17580 [Streptomyces tirandamycinicus]
MPAVTESESNLGMVPSGAVSTVGARADEALTGRCLTERHGVLGEGEGEGDGEGDADGVRLADGPRVPVAGTVASARCPPVLCSTVVRPPAVVAHG